jgi:hypothetical protein
MDKTEFYPFEVRLPLEEPQLARLVPRYELSLILESESNGSNDTWFRGVKDDAGLFPEFAETIETVEDGIVELEPSGELTNPRVFGMLQHQLLDRLVRRVDTNQENIGLSQVEIRVLDYLDVVLPISPDDEVVINAGGDENPRPSWFDYVTQQAEKIQDELIDGEIQADNLVVTPEVRVRAMREGRIARGREYLKNTAIIAGLGVTALVGGEVVGSVVNAESVENAAPYIADILGVWAGLRGFNWMAYSQMASDKEKDFARRLNFPLFNESDMSFDDLQTEINHEELQARREYETNVSVYNFDEAGKYYSGRQARSIVLHFLKAVERISNVDDPFVYLVENVEECLDEEMRGEPTALSEIYRLLDKYLPISDKDMVTPVNELTGEKTWRGFFEAYLTKKKKESVGN